MKPRGVSLLLVGVGAALTVALLAVARPAQVFALAGSSRPAGIATGAALAGGVLVIRGLRLVALARPGLAPARGTAVIAISQVATGVLPLRLGEVATVGLLHLAGIGGPARSVSLAVVMRLLDAATLLLFCAAALFWLRFPIAAPLALLALLGGALALAAMLGDRLLRRLAATRTSAGAARRRLLRGLLSARRELRHTLRAPRRVAAAVALSLLSWAGVWLQTIALLRAMSLEWPAGHVLIGVLGASTGAALPLNSVGSFGTMEAGWVAALAALGHDAGDALRAGFATHLWSVVFTIFFGSVALLTLIASHAASRRSS